MKNSDQKCGCGNSSEPIPLQIKVPADGCDCQTSKSETATDLKNEHYIIGEIQTPAGNVPRISTKLTMQDYFGSFKVRWGIRRDSYRVGPGLYAIGTPNEYSDVFVTANYKLTFDIVRKNLNGLNAWLLILDTKGVNVWCSAGKGTFGTKELVNRIQNTSLASIIKHRKLILPQLGATGVASHFVKEASGFTVLYGPVRISNIRSFIQAGYKATKEMRRVNFGFYDRAKLIPNDIHYNLRYLGGVLLFLFILIGIQSDGFSFRKAIEQFPIILQVVVAGYISGIVLTPLFLPYLPFRSFSFKGFLTGIFVSSILFFHDYSNSTIMIILAKTFFICGFSSFLAMNFTGASTYTSLAGVKKEMKIAVPIQIITIVLSAIFVIFSTILRWR